MASEFRCLFHSLCYMYMFANHSLSPGICSLVYSIIEVNTPHWSSTYRSVHCGTCKEPVWLMLSWRVPKHHDPLMTVTKRFLPMSLYLCADSPVLRYPSSGYELSLAQQYAAIGVLSIPILSIAGAGSAIFWIIGKKTTQIYPCPLSFLCCSDS